MSRCKAVSDFDAEEDGELSFKAGDVIVITNVDDESGWWTGYLEGADPSTAKLFPGNYVEMLGEPEANSESLPLPSDVEDSGNDGSQYKMDASAFEKKDVGSKFGIVVDMPEEEPDSDDDLDDKEVHYIKRGFVYEPSQDKRMRMAIIDTKTTGKFTKTTLYKIANVDQPDTVFCFHPSSNIKWFRKQLAVLYPCLAIPSIPNLKMRKDIEGLDTKEDLSIKSMGMMLNRVYQHPLISESLFVADFFFKSDPGDFKTYKKEYEGRRKKFWKKIRAGTGLPEAMDGDPKNFSVVGLLKRHLLQHDRTMSELLDSMDTYITDIRKRSYDQLGTVAEVFRSWSEVPFDWREEVPPVAKETSEGMKRALVVMADKFGGIVSEYSNLRQKSYRQLYLSIVELRDFAEAMQAPMKRLLDTQKVFSLKTHAKQKLELRTIQSESDRQRYRKAEKEEAAARKERDAVNRIFLAECEYFRTTRMELVVKLLREYFGGEIDFLSFEIGNLEEMKQALDSVKVSEGYDV